MRRLEMLSLAVGATVVVALAGASSAFAVSTTLCSSASSTCPAGNQYPVGTVFKAETRAVKARLTLPKANGTVECDSTVEGKTTGTSATVAGALMGEITSLKWSNCKLQGELCTVTSSNLPWTAEFLANNPGDGNGSLTITQKTGGGVPGFELSCGEVIDCTYTFAKAVLAFTGGTGGTFGTAHAVASAIALTAGGTGSRCPAAIWDASYYLHDPSTGIWIEN